MVVLFSFSFLTQTPVVFNTESAGLGLVDVIETTLNSNQAIFSK